MSFIKQTLKNTASLLVAVGIIGSAYAAISTVSSGDPLTADSWNSIVNKLNNTDTNSTDLVTKSYVDSAISANSGGGYPIVRNLSTNNSTAMSHLDAINYCNNLTEDGFSDWRLGTQEELSLLVGHENANGYSRSLSRGYSSNTYYSVNLSNGNTQSINPTYANNTAYFVNCVR